MIFFCSLYVKIFQVASIDFFLFIFTISNLLFNSNNEKLEKRKITEIYCVYSNFQFFPNKKYPPSTVVRASSIFFSSLTFLFKIF